MYQFSVRTIYVWFVAIGVAVSGQTRDAWGVDDYVAPPQSEREAVAELRAKGAILQVDGNYRVYSAVLLSNCTNEDLKRLAALEGLTNLQLQSPRITDDGIDHLKAVPKLTTIMVSSSGITDAGIAALKAAQPNLRVTRLGGLRSGPTTGPAGSSPLGTSVTRGQLAATRGHAADEVGVKFIESGVTAKVGGYVPIRAEMNTDSSVVQKAPEGLERAKYGTL